MLWVIQVTPCCEIVQHYLPTLPVNIDEHEQSNQSINFETEEKVKIWRLLGDDPKWLHLFEHDFEVDL